MHSHAHYTTTIIFCILYVCLVLMCFALSCILFLAFALYSVWLIFSLTLILSFYRKPCVHISFVLLPFETQHCPVVVNDRGAGRFLLLSDYIVLYRYYKNIDTGTGNWIEYIYPFTVTLYVTNITNVYFKSRLWHM